ncbi:hypothetical protein KEM54_003388, partial [Ascosphaera aggregata]
MARGRRAAAKAAAESLNQEDEEMRDASIPSTPKDEELSEAGEADNGNATTITRKDQESAADQNEDDNDADGDNDGDGDDDAATQQSTLRENDDTPQPQESSTSAQATPVPEGGSIPGEGSSETPTRLGGRVSATLPRKRRLGRPPKNRGPDYGSPESEVKHDPSTSTPLRRRGRGRPSAGGRWGRARGGPSHITQVPLDAEGKTMNVVNDEVELPIDEEGETK